MNESSSRDETKDLRKALQFAVCKIIFREDREQGTRTTESAIAALTELTFQYATKSLIPDLHIFSAHANRKSTILPDDVAVVLRKLQPDQLEAFKRNFCRSGSKSVSSKNASSSLLHGNEDKRKRPVVTAGRRRKRNETEALSLNLLSTSSDESDCIDDNQRVRKQKAVGKYVGGLEPKSGASGSSAARRGNSPSPTFKRNTGGKKDKEREHLLNKFQLQSHHNSRRNKEDVFDYGASSTDDDDMIRSPSRGIAIAKSARSKITEAATSVNRSAEAQKLASKEMQVGERCEQQQAKKRRKQIINRNKKRLIDNDDDSTDEDDVFLHLDTRKTKGMPDSKNNQQIVSSFGENQVGLKPNENSDQEFGVLDERHITSRDERGARKQSQVAELLANLSSDSGMDDDDSEDGVRINTEKRSSSARRRPLIQSDEES